MVLASARRSMKRGYRLKEYCCLDTELFRIFLSVASVFSCDFILQFYYGKIIIGKVNTQKSYYFLVIFHLSLVKAMN